MNLQLLTKEDWEEFRKDNQFAYGWLEGRSLLREYRQLKRWANGGLSPHLQDRYKELKELFGEEGN